MMRNIQRNLDFLERVRPQRKTILLFGGLAIFGGSLSVIADIYSAYLPNLSMPMATSVSLESVATILSAKSHEDNRKGSDPLLSHKLTANIAASGPSGTANLEDAP